MMPMLALLAMLVDLQCGNVGNAGDAGDAGDAGGLVMWECRQYCWRFVMPQRAAVRSHNPRATRQHP